jgi:mannosyltransferase OCH1-like enzyme
MKSDLFRLAYLYRHGGVYIDADDAYAGANMDSLFREDGLFRLRTASFRKTPSDSPVTVFNNNPIFCVPQDEIFRKALARATTIMLSLGKRDTYNVLLTTGPVNLSEAVYATALDCIANNTEFLFCPIIGWDDIAKKNTGLEYQKTERNWRAPR